MSNDLREIKNWLNAHGIEQEDQNIILEECEAFDAVCERYTDIARNEVIDLQNWFANAGMCETEQQFMIAKCYENPETYRNYLNLARNNGRRH